MGDSPLFSSLLTFDSFIFIRFLLTPTSGFLHALYSSSFLLFSLLTHSRVQEADSWLLTSFHLFPLYSFPFYVSQGLPHGLYSSFLSSFLTFYSFTAIRGWLMTSYPPFHLSPLYSFLLDAFLSSFLTFYSFTGTGGWAVVSYAFISLPSSLFSSLLFQVTPLWGVFFFPFLFTSFFLLNHGFLTPLYPFPRLSFSLYDYKWLFYGLLSLFFTLLQFFYSCSRASFFTLLFLFSLHSFPISGYKLLLRGLLSSSSFSFTHFRVVLLFFTPFYLFPPHSSSLRLQMALSWVLCLFLFHLLFFFSFLGIRGWVI